VNGRRLEACNGCRQRQYRHSSGKLVVKMEQGAMAGLHRNISKPGQGAANERRRGACMRRIRLRTPGGMAMLKLWSQRS
jgi:hypothetical protein